MNNIVLQYGDGLRHENPSLQAIQDAMQSAKTGEGPPELQLQQGEFAVGQPQLWVMCLFADAGLPTEWCVRFVRFKSSSSKYLARNQPTKDVFLRRTLCGCVENIRKECVLDESAVIPAVSWFRDHGTAAPSLVWVPSEDFQADF